MSRLFWKKTQRIARIPARSDPPSEEPVLVTEEGLPITSDECLHIQISTEDDDDASD